MGELEDLTDNQKIILLALDDLDNKSKINNLYIQKMFFLVTKLMPDKLSEFNNDYQAYDLGPYSDLLAEYLHYLTDLGFVDKEQQTLTNKARAIIPKIKHGFRKETNALGDFINDLKPLNDGELLYLVYRLYPEYTTGSKISSMVKSKLFQAFTIKVTSLKENNEIVVKTDKGNLIKVKKEGKVIKISDD